MQQDLRTKCVMNLFPGEAQGSLQIYKAMSTLYLSWQSHACQHNPIDTIPDTSFWKTTVHLNSGKCFYSLSLFFVFYHLTASAHILTAVPTA